MVDFTPGFNLSHWGPIPYPAASGTKTVLGAHTTGRIASNVIAGGNPRTPDYSNPPKSQGRMPAVPTKVANQPTPSGPSLAQQQAAAQAAANAKAIAAYNQSIQNQQAALNRQNSVYNSGYANAQSAYNDAVNQLNQGKALANQTYTKNVGQTKQDYVGAKNTISSNAGSSLNSLLRLLGAHGAGGGSAALYGAPQAVTRQATLQRNDASGTYGKNMQALDTGWNNYLDAYQQNLTAADRQRQNDINKAKSTVDQSRASILQTLADLFGKRTAIGGGDAQAAAQPYLNQANQYLNEAAALGRGVPVPRVAPAVYTAPSLADYTVNPNATPTVEGQAQTTDYTSPYLAALLGKKQDNTAAVPIGA